ncbi:hypothetical protein KTQ42_11940|uniref:hypothetical protein n=1 Tax=Noviherbaspirillum sp. L7-7A TaxID=2850560 RepID=UPI001C2BFEEF|nr:hypothetical protein [Noviherbaspirillum sp. L7-7A]MBV0880015.1 hypothetical protein [Noviherbaspirillum sp. L7-7A]
MMIGLTSGATGGNGSAMRAASPGVETAYAGSTAGNVLTTSSSIVSLSTSASTRQTSADELGLYGPHTSSAVEMAQRLRQAADEKLHPKTGSAQNPMSDVMLMLLIAQAKAYLSSKAGSI